MYISLRFLPSQNVFGTDTVYVDKAAQKKLAKVNLIKKFGFQWLFSRKIEKAALKYGKFLEKFQYPLNYEYNRCNKVDHGVPFSSICTEDGREQFILLNTGHSFVKGSVLGMGASGKVRICMRRSDSALMAIKKVRRTPDSSNNIFTVISAFQEEHSYIQRMKNSAENLGIVSSFSYESEFIRSVNSKREDTGYLVLPLGKEDGVTRFMHRGIALDLLNVQKMAQQLAVCHAAGIVHNDVKPNNFIFNDQGDTLLLDFDFAENIQSLTTGCVGTPFYLSPEMKLTKLRIGNREKTDIWSFGMMLFEIVAWEKSLLHELPTLIPKKCPGSGYDAEIPFKDCLDSQIESFVKGLCKYTESGFFSVTDSTIQNIIIGCLKKDPKDRLSADQIIARIDIALAGEA